MSDIPRGMQIAVQALIKMLGLDPVRMQNSVEEIGKSISNGAARLETIERDLKLIKAHFGITDLTLEQGLIDARSDETGTGNLN